MKKNILEILKICSEFKYDNFLINYDKKIKNLKRTEKNTFSFLERYSCRTYQNKIVDHNIINWVIEVSFFTPSVCNRSPWKIYTFNKKQDEELITSILKIQGGAKGFSNEIYNLALITVDLSSYEGSGELFEPYISGGMYASNFINILNSVGLSSCCLNWSKDFYHDVLLRKYIKIPYKYKIIMFIAFGYSDKIVSRKTNSIRLDIL